MLGRSSEKVRRFLRRIAARLRCTPPAGQPSNGVRIMDARIALWDWRWCVRDVLLANAGCEMTVVDGELIMAALGCDRI